MPVLDASILTETCHVDAQSGQHEMQFAKQISDRVCFFDKGRIVEQGSHSQLIANSGLYARLASLQFDAPEGEAA